MALPKGITARPSKRSNGKFNRGSKAWAERQIKLSKILERMRDGKSFGDLQGA
jgi:hypothetical protein